MCHDTQRMHPSHVNTARSPCCFIQNQSVDQCALKVLTTGSHLAAKQLGNFYTRFRDIVKVKVVLAHISR